MKTRVTDGLTIINPKEKSDRKEILALTIEQACGVMKKLLDSGINRRAIIVLVHDACPKGNYRHTGASRRQVGDVLDALAELSETYCTR